VRTDLVAALFLASHRVPNRFAGGFHAIGGSVSTELPSAALPRETVRVRPAAATGDGGISTSMSLLPRSL